ncbi:hypothetical protein RJT34_00590 [Clitoria ternatea]|uniref:Uncharacterized protein n=1 Tax=Clitoria ternatea TaxID=43366 RepID=A0AAN9KIE7_CLITE
MGIVKGNGKKKNLIVKVWERLRRPLKLKGSSKSKVPNGCFSVHVGPLRERFVVKTEHANHPLFKALLEEAEQEYGFETDGPIWLPCNVELFYKVLAEMDGEEEIDNNLVNHRTRSFAKIKVFPFFVLRSPTRLLCYVNTDHTTAYSVMNSEFLRINHFH